MHTCSPQTREVFKFDRLFFKRILEIFNGFHCLLNHPVKDDRFCSRVGIVGRLAHVDVRVRMNFIVTFAARQNFVSPVRDDFVNVHIDPGPMAAPNIDGELIGEFSCDDLITGLSFMSFESLDFFIGKRRGLFYFSNRSNHVRKFVESMIRHIIVLSASDSLNTVVGFFRNRKFA